jgi:hypothetical protein
MSREFQQAPQTPAHQKIMEDPRIVEDLGGRIQGVVATV